MRQSAGCSFKQQLLQELPMGGIVQHPIFFVLRVILITHVMNRHNQVKVCTGCDETRHPHEAVIILTADHN